MQFSDPNAANFTDRGSLYTTNVTFGQVDGNIVWKPQNTSANMMECPDLFPLGDKWVLIGSLYKTNQWWVGTLAGDPPRFTPERVGILDYGNGYAAKTGSTWVQNDHTRRLVFGFTGWNEPTMPAGCGRALVIPRELSVSGSELITAPIPEAAVLRVSSSHLATHVTSSGSAAIAAGSHVEVRLLCAISAAAVPTTGKTGIRTLSTADGSQYTELGYDWEKQTFYADHTRCCSAASRSPIVQAAPLPVAALGAALNMTVFVDGGLIEAFLGGRVITPLVAPNSSAGLPAARVTTVIETTGAVDCSVDSWQLAY